MQNLFRPHAIHIITAAILLVFLSHDSQAQNRKGYYPGDWVSYTQTRFVTSVGLGWSDVYFGTTGGIMRYASLEKTWKNPITTSDGLPTNEIWQIAVRNEDDRIHVLTPLGAWSYDPAFQDWRMEDAFPDHLEAPNFDRYKDFLTYHLDVGYRMTEETDLTYLIDPFFREYRVINAVEDRFDHLWVATYGHGIADVDLMSDFVTLRPHGLYQEDVQAVYVNDDMVWFGGKAGPSTENALTRWNRKTDEWSYFESRYHDRISSDEVNEIVGDDKHVFFATDNGLIQYRKKNEKFRSFTRAFGLRSTEVYSLLLEDSILLIGGNGTIDVLVTTTGAVLSFDTPEFFSSKVLTMTRFAGYLWVGTDYGVYRLNIEKNKWSRFNTPSGHLGGVIYQIVEGPFGFLWFVGSDGVIQLDDTFAEVEAYLTHTDLKDLTPHRIAFTGERLLIGTDNGVLRYDRLLQMWDSYSVDDGLIDNYINDIKLDSNHVWFATPSGATRFYWNNPLRTRDN